MRMSKASLHAHARVSRHWVAISSRRDKMIRLWPRIHAWDAAPYSMAIRRRYSWLSSSSKTYDGPEITYDLLRALSAFADARTDQAPPLTLCEAISGFPFPRKDTLYTRFATDLTLDYGWIHIGVFGQSERSDNWSLLMLKRVGARQH